MGSFDRPKLRALPAYRHEQGGKTYAAFEDPSGAFDHHVLIPIADFQLMVRHFDGQTTLAQIQDRVRRETGRHVPTGVLEDLVDQLDRSMVLDGQTYHEFRERDLRPPTRRAAFAGRSYPGSERSLRAHLDLLFDHTEGAGAPRPDNPATSRKVRAIISPHIDFQRGGTVYTWSYKELVERSEADVFVILGVAHQPCGNRFALTRKDFDTPLGVVRNDRAFVDRIASHAGRHLFDDELVHRTEHSIEFQVVFLNYLLRNRRDFTIVPILVGSFHDLMTSGVDPIEDDEVRRFVEALQLAEAASGKTVAYIGGIDLSHVGPEFGDREPVQAATIEKVAAFDRALLDRAAAQDPRGWFRTAADVGNRWRVCGLAATYTLLHAIGPTHGRLLQYRQSLDDRRTCFVSFASLVFDAVESKP